MDSLRAAVELEDRLDVQADIWRQIAEINRRRGTYAAAHEGLSRAEACLAQTTNPLPMARVRIARSMLAVARGADAEARMLGAEAIALLADEPTASAERATAYRAVGIAAASEDDLPVAREAFGRALEAAQDGKDALLVATISLNLGTVLHLQGHLDQALDIYHQALEFHERIGAKRGVALVANNLGDLYWRSGDGDWETAHAYWQRSLRLYEEIGDQRGIAVTLRNLGDAHVLLNAPQAAEPLLSRARGMAQEMADAELLDAIDQQLARLWSARQAA
jgi:tetratricopeptide (TPR) repeat protein